MAARDPYEVLGVERAATQEAIRRAYHKLAKQHHPDLNPDDADAERRFKEATAAHEILGDEARRARFDRGEIDASGQEAPPRPSSRGFTGGDFAAQEGFVDEADLKDFLNGMFGAQAAGRRPQAARGANVVLTVAVPFVEACLGGKRRLSIPNRPAIEVNLPAGVRDGEMIRIPGKGEPGYDGGPPGDAFVEVNVRPHRFFTRRDGDIHVDLPITFAEAVLGGSVRAPTIHGPVEMKISAGAKAGARMRLRAKGVPDGRGGFGDQYVRLVIAAPEAPDEDLKTCLAEWAKRRAENPRADMER